MTKTELNPSEIKIKTEKKEQMHNINKHYGVSYGKCVHV